MADHMTAERDALLRIADELEAEQEAEDRNSGIKYTASNQGWANELRNIAARLSGMAAVPADHVVVPRDVALLVRRVFLPTNPNKMRNAAPETVAAAQAFIAAAAPEPPNA